MAPLDGQIKNFLPAPTKPKVRSKPAIPALDKPSIAALIYILTHRSKWPEDFNWNYGDIETCAIGMAYELWGDISHRAIKEKTDSGYNANLYSRAFYHMSWQSSAVTIAKALKSALAKEGDFLAGLKPNAKVRR